MKPYICQNYVPEKYEQKTLLFPIKFINFPTLSNFEQYQDILIGFNNKKHYVWQIQDDQIHLIYQIQNTNNNEYSQVCTIWIQDQQVFILIQDEKLLNILDLKNQQIIQSYDKYLDITFPKYNIIQQFQQTQFLYYRYENSLKLIKFKNQTIKNQFILQNKIQYFQTKQYTQYISMQNQLLMRRNKSNKIYRKVQGHLKAIKEPFFIQTRVQGFKGYNCQIVDMRNMKLRLNFSCINEDFKDSLYIEELNLILILNEYSLWVFSSINMKLLDIEYLPNNKVSLAEPWKLNYRLKCLEIYCQQFSMNQFYR